MAENESVLQYGKFTLKKSVKIWLIYSLVEQCDVHAAESVNQCSQHINCIPVSLTPGNPSESVKIEKK